jgi:protein TonB
MSGKTRFHVNTIFSWMLLLSIAVHLVSVFLLEYQSSLPKPPEPIRISIKESAKIIEPVATIPEPVEPPPPLPPPPPKPKPKPKPKTKSTPEATPPSAEPSKPSSGLSPDSLAPAGQGKFTAPMGNTLAEPPPAERDFKAAPGDLGDRSRDALLIVQSVPKVDYTDEAIDAGFEGAVIVDVFVEANGQISSAEIRKAIGYGMDERIIQAAKKAKFNPRLNSQGIPERGWTEIQFNLIIP